MNYSVHFKKFGDAIIKARLTEREFVDGFIRLYFPNLLERNTKLPNTMLCGSADSSASAAKPSATQAESAAATVRRELP